MSKVKNEKNVKRIKVIGIGGSGCNIINYLQTNYEFNDNVKLIGSDSATCGMAKCKNKLPLERVYPIYCKVKGILENNDKTITDIMCCEGCMGNPILGELSAYYKYDEILKELKGTDTLVLTTVLGGGTGCGAIKIFIQVAQKLDINVFCIIAKPNAFEGNLRMEKSDNALKDILKMNVELIECEIFENSINNGIAKYFSNGDVKMAKKIYDFLQMI